MPVPITPPRSLHVIGGVGLGGAERFFIRLVNALHRHGAPVAAVTTAGGGIAAGIDAEVRHYHARQGFNWDPWSRWKIRQAIHDFRPDIVQTYMGRATRLVRLNPGDGALHVARLGGYYNLKHYCHADAWVGNTRGIHDYLISYGFPSVRCAHIGNFADPPAVVANEDRARLRQTLNIEPEQRMLLGLGRFHPNKGWIDLLDAFAGLPLEQRAKLILVMVGAGPLENSLKTRARTLGIDRQTRWPGWQLDPSPWYQTCDVFICASRHEPLGNVVLEAWANRALLVSTRAEGPLELIHDGVDGILCNVSDPASLRIALQQALALDASARMAMLDAGASRAASEFSEDAIVRQYLAFYAHLLANDHD